MTTISRRGVLKGLFGGAVVLGFDPVGRSWVTEAQAGVPFADLPPLQGTLSTDPASLAEVSDDFGHIVHRTPLAVLHAASVDDVVKMVRYARSHGLKIVGRGNGHTVLGQAQVAGGIVIDMRGMNQIYSITPHGADVDAGVVWRDLLVATTNVGLTPPVLTDYLYLTVGGTLSVGGIGGRSFRYGVEVDNVEQLTVVTGTGDIFVCSANQHANLFNAALAGLGLCAIIVRATLRLIKAKERALSYDLPYTNVTAMLDDLRTVVRQNRFDYVRGTSVWSPTGWTYFLEVTNYYTPGDCGDDDDDDDDDDDHDPAPANLLQGLSFIPGSMTTTDRTYFDYCDATDGLFAQLQQAGLLALPHPWLDIFVPSSSIDAFAAQTVAEESLSLFLPGSFLLFFAFKRNRITRPLFRVPDEDMFFLFDVIRTAPPDPQAVSAILQDNRRLYDKNRALGGTSYTISAVQMSPADWRAHFGPAWPLLAQVKANHDPDNVLGGGVSVFG